MDKIRPLTPLDAPWLALFHRQGFEAPWTAQSFADLLGAPAVLGWTVDSAAGPGIILTQDDGGVADILTIQVARAAQGRGFGQALLGHALAALRTRGVARVCLEVAQNNTAAKKLYQNEGFRLEGVRKRYYRTATGRRDAEIWVRTL